MNTKSDKYFEFASEEKKLQFLKEIVGFFESERNEEIGLLAAEEILDFFVETLGKDIYNKAFRDAQGILREKLEEADANIEFIIGKNKHDKY